MAGPWQDIRNFTGPLLPFPLPPVAAPAPQPQIDWQNLRQFAPPTLAQQPLAIPSPAEMGFTPPPADQRRVAAVHSALSLAAGQASLSGALPARPEGVC
jgi:hypothetical protein